MLSVRSCRTIWPRPAPRARRIPISFVRVAPRARKKIRDIGAGDQMDEKDRAHDEQREHLEILHHLLAERVHVHARAAVRLRILGREPRR